MLDHDTDSYDKIAGAFVDGKPTGNLTRDHILDNITLYWLTGTGASAAQVVLGKRTGRSPGRRQDPAAGLDPGRASRPSPARSSARRAAGSSTPIRTSSTSTRPPEAATSPPGRSRSSSAKSSGRRSPRSAERRANELRVHPTAHGRRPRLRLRGAEPPGRVHRHVHQPVTSTLGDVRLHAVIGGDGPPLLLVHGWPQTWYAWRMVMPALARDFKVDRGRPARHRAVRQARRTATTPARSRTTWSR